MNPKKSRRGKDDGTVLPFDVTQDIDPSLVEELPLANEPTLTQADFEADTVVLPEQPKPRS